MGDLNTRRCVRQEITLLIEGEEADFALPFPYPDEASSTARTAQTPRYTLIPCRLELAPPQKTLPPPLIAHELSFNYQEKLNNPPRHPTAAPLSDEPSGKCPQACYALAAPTSRKRAPSKSPTTHVRKRKNYCPPLPYAH